MSDMKHFLERNSTSGKVALVMVGTVPLAAMVAFEIGTFQDGVDLSLMLFPAFPFLLMSAFCGWMLYRSIRDYPKWWESLTDAQRADYELDFANAQPVEGFLLLGRKYAYIRRIGKPIAYENIADIYFHRTKSGNGMHVILRDGTRMGTIAPPFTNRQAVTDALLLNRCEI